MSEDGGGSGRGIRKLRKAFGKISVSKTQKGKEACKQWPSETSGDHQGQAQSHQKETLPHPWKEQGSSDSDSSLDNDPKKLSSSSSSSRDAHLKPYSSKRIPYKVVEVEDGVIEYYNDYDPNLVKPRKYYYPPPITAERKRKLAEVGIIFDSPPKSAQYRGWDIKYSQLCEVCSRPGHVTDGCPYLSYLPPDAHINDDVAFKMCRCGQNFLEDGPCPEYCRERKFAMLKFIYNLPPTYVSVNPGQKKN